MVNPIKLNKNKNDIRVEKDSTKEDGQKQLSLTLYFKFFLGVAPSINFIA